MSKTVNFESFGLSEDILSALKEKGFEEPTPIQKKTIPVIMNSTKDVVGQAQTGTGKTAAFGLPIIEMVDPKVNKIQAFILTPTRELAGQIAEEINSLKGKRKLRVTAIYGGQSMSRQIRVLKDGAQIVIGTPGRVLDHIKRKNLDLNFLKLMILDEADEMLNMGFIKDVEKILKFTPKKKRTFLFSATMPPKILNLAKKHMNDYEYLRIENRKITAQLTEQVYFEVKESDKFEALSRIIDMEEEFYGLIFCRTKVDVDRIAQRLKNRGYSAEGIHGDISQNQREKIFRMFKEKKIKVLVATDVAARGINVDNLTHVVNYALPQDPESYVHRIGRTGRAGKEGVAITLITPYEYRKFAFIQKITKTDVNKKSIPNAADIIESKKDRIKSSVLKTIENNKYEKYEEFAKKLLEGNDPEKVVAGLIEYSFSKELDEKNYSKVEKSVARKGRSDSSFLEDGGNVRLFVAKGSSMGITKKDLVDEIEEKTGIPSRLIDDVRLFDDFSFITVPYEESKLIINIFKNQGKDRRPLVVKAKPRENNNQKNNFKKGRFRGGKRFKRASY